ncbi:MAG: class I SAM-dependent methyltransferase [Candidatus Coatesbacteria bacterium]|nr:class I SAM-dependent methyltransferase [Candidatus Coatesbacteria bacterium]
MKRVIRVLRRTFENSLAAIRGPKRNKAAHELKYWRSRKAEEGTLSHDHYGFFYTTHFGLDEAFFRGKKILDIGCGPRGSLEWAEMASERVGLDPLADSYRALGTDKHKMTYVASPAERIPFSDGYFDVVCSFNSLDHVNDLDQTVSEIIRVVAPGGLFLLLTDVNHDPTPCEPIAYSWDVVEKFFPQMELVEEKHFEKSQGGMYKSIRSGIAYTNGDKRKRYGILSAKFRKKR